MRAMRLEKGQLPPAGAVLAQSVPGPDGRVALDKGAVLGADGDPDLGGGKLVDNAGDQVIACGSPESIAANKRSATAQFLRPLLTNSSN